jgi:hypothetical protein
MIYTALFDNELMLELIKKYVAEIQLLGNGIWRLSPVQSFGMACHW